MKCARRGQSDTGEKKWDLDTDGSWAGNYKGIDDYWETVCRLAKRKIALHRGEEMEKHMIKLENGENSYIKITGEVGQELCYSHTSFGERFYEVPVEVKRFSGNIDKVPVILPERFAAS